MMNDAFLCIFSMRHFFSAKCASIAAVSNFWDAVQNYSNVMAVTYIPKQTNF